MTDMIESNTIQTDKPFLDALAGQRTQSVPFWFMRQAGRYLPEYRELRAQKGGFMDMAMDPKAATEVTLQPIRRYGMDAAIIFSDILTIPYALGQTLDFVPGEGPKLDAIDDDTGIKKLGYGEFKTKLAPVYEALETTRAALKTEGFNNTALIGFAGAPWTVATYMIEGGSSRDFLKIKKFAYQNPSGFAALIDLLVEATASYLINQIQAGAEAVQIFDSWAGALDAGYFQKYSIEPTRKIVELVKEAHPHTPIIGFPKGAGYGYLKYVQETGVNALGIDSSVPTKWAAQSLQKFASIQGNLDPMCLLAGGDALKMAAERIIADLRDGPFIFNLGHGINKETPPEHVEDLVKIIRSYS